MGIIQKILLFGLAVCLIIAVVLPIMREIKDTGRDSFNIVRSTHNSIKDANEPNI